MAVVELIGATKTNTGLKVECELDEGVYEKGVKITNDEMDKGREELVEAQKELDRPKVGRSVRREGKAETIAEERAALADSLANAPSWNIIEN